ncbi:YrdB family protein [Dictyobacter aurantiacus]|uniref:DUF2568 domain-containing protein n=1 Tax=Dictyobacter aurantiacus TaxID=1936993 RepID=A0A401Z8G0_9CHLR|nr:YrdB family protein [Dictyobacter aurantiacus]GCE03123.1 hypothetical protein KDAU_04520 [Dictyobacter aurantiacus]
MSLSLFKNMNLALVFFLELGVLVALGYWGFHNGQGIIGKIALGIGAPVLAIVVWGIWGAPKSQWHLQGPWYLLLQIVFFGSAALALYAASQRLLGIVFAILVVLACGLAYMWRDK